MMLFMTIEKRSHGPLEFRWACGLVLLFGARTAGMVARDAGSGDSVGASGGLGLHARRIDREGDTPLIGQLARGWTQAAGSWDKTYARCRLLLENSSSQEAGLLHAWGELPA
jgi:hypothetical protein